MSDLDYCSEGDLLWILWEWEKEKQCDAEDTEVCEFEEDILDGNEKR